MYTTSERKSKVISYRDTGLDGLTSPLGLAHEFYNEVQIINIQVTAGCQNYMYTVVTLEVKDDLLLCIVKNITEWPEVF